MVFEQLADGISTVGYIDGKPLSVLVHVFSLAAHVNSLYSTLPEDFILSRDIVILIFKTSLEVFELLDFR